MVNLLIELTDHGVLMLDVVCRVESAIFLRWIPQNIFSRCSENIFVAKAV